MDIVEKSDPPRTLRWKGAFLLGVLLPLIGCKFYDHLGGNFRGEPSEMAERLSLQARNLIEEAFKDIDPNRLVDYHVHIVGLGKGVGSLCETGTVDDSNLYLDPMRFSWRHPVWRIKTGVLMSASRITSMETANEQYAQRLLELTRHFRGRGKFYLLALDGYHEEDGTLNLEQTDILIPNQYVIDLTTCLNKKLNADPIAPANRFVPVVSIHPYRKDAVEKLREFHEQGVRFIKWLPNIMNIDPAHARVDGFYKEMARLKMVLITHTGKESTLRAPDEHQGYGNPQRLRRALDLGVTVIMAHSGRDGSNVNRSGKLESNFNLFLNMMEEPRYKNCLFGELSALTIRDGTTLDYLEKIMANPQLRGRMVNGSDYPLPAVDFLNPTGLLADKKYISRADKRALDEIYSFNPLLFDFVVKRTIRHPKQRELRLPASMFLSIDTNGAGKTTCPEEKILPL